MARPAVLPHKVLRGKGKLYWGTPAQPLRDYLKELAAIARLTRKETKYEVCKVSC